jgi:hypothetical protein
MLSENFSLAEFLRSETAQQLGIANIPNETEIAAMATLCVKVLEPLRAHFRWPVRITSGFRVPALCLAIGSTATSQHVRGEASDIEIDGVSNFIVASWIADNLPFDQLILENHVRGQPNSGWVHVSYREGRLRRDKLTIMRGTTFSGLIA